MATSRFDTQSITVPCPVCGLEIERSVAWIKSNGHFLCDGCGSLITLLRDRFLEDLQSADRLIAYSQAQAPRRLH